jgi:antibiotic biosynthesis monooxygenase (ABM) superfamily enzyme
MVVTVFRSKLRPENAESFQALADRMMAIASAMPGFISYKVYRAEDGERCSVIEFDTHEHLLRMAEPARTREGAGTRSAGVLRELQPVGVRPRP